MNVDVYNTHIEIYPYTYGDYPILEEKFTAIDKIKGKPFPCGYMISEGKLYLPRGASLTLIEHLTETKPNIITDSDERLEMRGFSGSTVEPRDEIQKAAIKFLEQDEHQIALEGKTGFGKTICVCYALTELREKAMIVTPTENIQIQWYRTLSNTFRYRDDDILILRGSNSIDAVLDGYVEPADVYLVSHNTLRNYLMSNNGFKFHQMFQKLGIGVKVYDESHQHFQNILLIDFFTNTHRTWYLTATFSRSDKTERECFERAFASVHSFGKRESELVMPKHVVYHMRTIATSPDHRNRAMLMAHPGFSSIKYGKYAFSLDPNDATYKEIKQIVYECRNLEGKLLIFVPLIDNVETVGSKLKKDFPEKTVGIYHSQISQSEKETAQEKDVIVSTIKSFGTGTDIPDLRAVVCAEPFASKVTAEQVIGRLRPYPGGLECHYFDIVDVSIPPCNWWHRARMFKIKDIVKTVIR